MNSLIMIFFLFFKLIHVQSRITPITRPYFISKIYNYFYPPPHIRRNFTKKDAHKLGLLYIYIALGLLADERQPLLSTEAEKYYQLARAAYVFYYPPIFKKKKKTNGLSVLPFSRLSLDRICDHPTLHGLQCMVCVNLTSCTI